jgi:hypothetical protein
MGRHTGQVRSSSDKSRRRRKRMTSDWMFALRRTVLMRVTPLMSLHPRMRILSSPLSLTLSNLHLRGQGKRYRGQAARGRDRQSLHHCWHQENS